MSSDCNQGHPLQQRLVSKGGRDVLCLRVLCCSRAFLFGEVGEATCLCPSQEGFGTAWCETTRFSPQGVQLVQILTRRMSVASLQSLPLDRRVDAQTSAWRGVLTSAQWRQALQLLQNAQQRWLRLQSLSCRPAANRVLGGASRRFLFWFPVKPLASLRFG